MDAKYMSSGCPRIATKRYAEKAPGRTDMNPNYKGEGDGGGRVEGGGEVERESGA
jgi:hypothetical protein